MVRDMLQGLRAEAAPGADGVPNALLRQLAWLSGGRRVGAGAVCPHVGRGVPPPACVAWGGGTDAAEGGPGA
eukprot:1391865-Prorocentrum_lima.AAC.1